MKYIIPEDLSLLDALAYFFPKSSKTSLRSWIKEERVLLDGQLVKNSLTVALKGQELTLTSKKKFAGENTHILYEDAHIVVIDKPSGLLSVSTAFEKGETAHAILKNYYKPKHVHVVHRLDQDTSGVMLFALDADSCERMKKIFEKHDIEREYTAIVEGAMEESEGTWESYLYEDDNYFVHSSENPKDGEKAITHFRTIFKSKSYSVLQLKLETGKKNQIRVHCQIAGHPVVGDKKYGAKTNPLKRLCLHAHTLAFNHPITHKKMRFESNPPSEFGRLVKNQRLQKNAPQRPKEANTQRTKKRSK